jgi:hypothetical protein
MTGACARALEWTRANGANILNSFEKIIPFAGSSGSRAWCFPKGIPGWKLKSATWALITELDLDT